MRLSGRMNGWTPDFPLWSPCSPHGLFSPNKPLKWRLHRVRRLHPNPVTPCYQRSYRIFSLPLAFLAQGAYNRGSGKGTTGRSGRVPYALIERDSKMTTIRKFRFNVAYNHSDASKIAKYLRGFPCFRRVTLVTTTIPGTYRLHVTTTVSYRIAHRYIKWFRDAENIVRAQCRYSA